MLLNAATALARPRTAARLWDSGLLRPGVRGAAGALRTAPWLLGRGASLGIVSAIHAHARADRPAVIDRRGTVTWGELDVAANRASGMLDSLDVGTGQRVGMLLRNGREWAEVALAAQKSNRVACPLNTWSRPGELRAVIEAMRPAVLVYDARHAEEVHEAAPDWLPLVAVGEGTVDGSGSYTELVAGASERPPSPRSGVRSAGGIVIQTSGTTGTPKGANRSIGGKALAGLLGLLTTVPFRDDDVVLCPAPLFHAFGLLTFSVATVLGATMVLPDRFEPADTLDDIERHRATAVSLVPVMIQRILALPDSERRGHDVSSLRILLASGSALSQERREAAMEVFGDVLYDLYGSTEAGWVAIATPADIRSRPGTLGRPVAGVDVRVVDESGRPLPAGEHGEIHVGGTMTFEGYTSGSRPTGGVRTGDRGWMDESGYLFVGGRADDMAVIGGENVYPAEVERVVEAVPGVEDAAVVSVPDDEYGEVLAAFVVGSATAEQILEAARRELASFKVPRSVRLVDELPRTSTGKIRAPELRRLVEEDGDAGAGAPV